MTGIETIGLDADDTLWHSEGQFVDIQSRYRTLLANHVDEAVIDTTLGETERRNLAVYGYGVKSFTLSMVETAIELTDGRIEVGEIAEIVSWSKEMLAHPIELLEGVDGAVRALTERYRVLIITKGDLLHQESKVARSGLAELIDGVEVLSEKDPDSYRRVFSRHAVDPATFLMAGNSVRSDVLPVIELGGHGAHIPYHLTWEHEVDEGANPVRDGYHVLDSVAELPALAERLTART